MIIIIKLQGRAINFSPLSNSAQYSLVFGETSKASNASLAEARYAKMLQVIKKLVISWVLKSLRSLGLDSIKSTKK